MGIAGHKEKRGGGGGGRGGRLMLSGLYCESEISLSVPPCPLLDAPFLLRHLFFFPPAVFTASVSLLFILSPSQAPRSAEESKN